MLRRNVGAGYWPVVIDHVTCQTAVMGEHTDKNAKGDAGGGTDPEATQVHQPAVPTATYGDSAAAQNGATDAAHGAAASNAAAGGSDTSASGNAATPGNAAASGKALAAGDAAASDHAPATGNAPAGGPAPAGGRAGGSRRAQREKESSVDWAAIRGRGVGLLAGIVRWVGLAFALVLVLHVVFVIGEANAENGIVQWVGDASRNLAVGFHDLFQPADPKLLVLINYGIAAIFWLVVSSIVAKVIRSVGGSKV